MSTIYINILFGFKGLNRFQGRAINKIHQDANTDSQIDHMIQGLILKQDYGNHQLANLWLFIESSLRFSLRFGWDTVKESILFFRQVCGTTLGVQPRAIVRKL